MIEPLDGLTGRRAAQGKLYAVMDGRDRAICRDGCLLFVGKPRGVHRITVGGGCYQPYELKAEFDDTVKIVTVVLMPSRGYKLHDGAVRLFGRAECAAKARFPYSGEQARILGEFKKGAKTISVFFSEKTPFCPYRRYSFGGGIEDHSLKYIGKMEYELDRPLEDDIGYDSAVGLSYEIIPSECGEYFLAAEGGFKTAEIVTGERVERIELIGGSAEYDIKEVL